MRFAVITFAVLVSATSRPGFQQNRKPDLIRDFSQDMKLDDGTNLTANVSLGDLDGDIAPKAVSHSDCGRPRVIVGLGGRGDHWLLAVRAADLTIGNFALGGDHGPKPHRYERRATARQLLGAMRSEDDELESVELWWSMSHVGLLKTRHAFRPCQRTRCCDTTDLRIDLEPLDQRPGVRQEMGRSACAKNAPSDAGGLRSVCRTISPSPCDIGLPCIHHRWESMACPIAAPIAAPTPM